MTAPDFIVLHGDDNVATALRDVPADTAATVTGWHGTLPDLAPATEIRLGHKAALKPIAAANLVIKHGVPMGRATADIAAGEHVHVHNVISLSQETDRIETAAGGAHG